jgi:hypothetical protein
LQMPLSVMTNARKRNDGNVLPWWTHMGSSDFAVDAIFFATVHVLADSKQ